MADSWKSTRRQAPSQVYSPAPQRPRSPFEAGAGFFSGLSESRQGSPAPIEFIARPPSRFSRLAGRQARAMSPPRSATPMQRAPSDGSEVFHNADPSPWRGSRGGEPPSFLEKRRKAIPVEHAESLRRTRKRVAEAVINVLDYSAYIVHDTLVLAEVAAQFLPFPGLQAAAMTLLNIWDALRMIDMNFLACYHLTERCATILFSVREEIAEAGDLVGKSLLNPISRLEEVFVQVFQFLRKQNHRPFITRYLKRDEILRDIQACDRNLNDALSMFTVSINIRIYTQVVQAEAQRQSDNAAFIEKLVKGSLQTHVPPLSTGGAFLQAATDDAVPVKSVDELKNATPEEIITDLQAITAQQVERDLAMDTEDLRRLTREAMETRNDAELISVLQVERNEMPEAIKTLQRVLENEEEHDGASTAGVENPVADQRAGSITNEEGYIPIVQTKKKTLSTRSPSSERPLHNILDRKFLETGIDALRRLSTVQVSLPSWTITRYEIEKDEKIGIGYFSNVFRGTWQDRVVAIKELVEFTPRSLFIREVTVWKKLKHPNVLELLGASSPSSVPPWFFVSPFCTNGSLISFLKDAPTLESVDVLKIINEIASGMAYLHSMNVLHGDLKGVNVLVNDDSRCVIADFGQSEMKSEIYRLTGKPMVSTAGTLRWQAPELMSGESAMTRHTDVYAFAICCVEVLLKGGLPWPHAGDDTVRHLVGQNKRPQIPHLDFSWRPQLRGIIERCWQFEPSCRPSFVTILEDIHKLYSEPGLDALESPTVDNSPEVDMDRTEHKSPGIPPMPSVSLPPMPPASLPQSRSSNNHHEAIPSPTSDRPSPASNIITRNFSETSQGIQKYPYYSDESGFKSHLSVDTEGVKLYRTLLRHEFPASLTLPLWSPRPVTLGDVGYHSAQLGEFVTLFNAFDPPGSSNGTAGEIPPLQTYGRVSTGVRLYKKRNLVQRGVDKLQRYMTTNGNTSPSPNVGRRYSCPLQAGEKAAYLFTEVTEHRFVKDLTPPKRWINEHANAVLNLYSSDHSLARELSLVTGTLDAQHYALFVNHRHPDGQLTFNVHSKPRSGQPWGHFTTTTTLSESFDGQADSDRPSAGQTVRRKVSIHHPNNGWDTVVLARLMFQTGRPESPLKD